MPGRNTRKTFIENHYYHLHNRGWNRSEIFVEDADYSYFESLLERHLSLAPVADARGRLYTHLRSEIDLVAYCLMPNHFHMLVFIRSEQAATKLMTSLMTAYTMYFNRKYKRRGSLCENRFKAVSVITTEQLMHVSRYIHLNKADYKTWVWSSYGDYLRDNARNWVASQTILELFSTRNKYVEFVDDYAEMQRLRDSIKRELAHG